MKILVLFLMVAVISDIYCTKNRRLQKWISFKRTFNKVYTSDIEEKKRFLIFKNNLKEINEHNKLYRVGSETYKKGVNPFADMTKQEFKERYNLWLPNDVPIIHYNYSNCHQATSFLEDYSFDWRQFGVVTPAKDQGSCGSCWIFSAVGALEGFLSKKTGTLVPLSEQNIVDCYSNSTCEGGFPEMALQWAKNHGVSKEADYPYKERHVRCTYDRSKILNMPFDQIVKINNTEGDLRKALEKHGPLVISLYVTNRWHFYKSGVWYDPECSDVTNHSMLLVGYGKEKGLDYWLIKNSWGKEWGEGGFIKVARNKHENYCGITAESFYVV